MAVLFQYVAKFFRQTSFNRFYCESGETDSYQKMFWED